MTVIVDWESILLRDEKERWRKMKKLHRMTKNTGCCQAYHLGTVNTGLAMQRGITNHKNNYLHISNVEVVATSDYIGALTFGE